MKKLLFGLIATVFLGLSVNAQELTSKTYDYLGKIHNQALDNFIKNFKDKEIENVDGAVSYIADFNKLFYSNSSLSTSEKENIITYNSKFKYFVSSNDFYDYISSNSNSYISLSQSSKYSVEYLNGKADLNSNKGALTQLISNCKSKKIIDDFEYIKLMEIEKMIIDNKNGKISISELENKLNSIARDFDGKEYKTSDKKGHILATVLSISINSIEWWQNNGSLYTSIRTSGKGGPNVIDYEEVILVAPWVAADVGGAIIGATIGAVSSYTTSGEVSGTAMGIGALAGAVTASTGIAGKLGSKIFSLFS